MLLPHPPPLLSMRLEVVLGGCFKLLKVLPKAVVRELGMRRIGGDGAGEAGLLLTVLLSFLVSHNRGVQIL